MRIIVFAGPSFPPGERGAFPGVEWRPPAQAGDLLRLEPEPGLTICLVDGYFDHRPAVRHKEILLHLSLGVRILGASSIGALRAAEMAPFGMEGIGAVYRAYADGRIVGDDEVALIHAGPEADWKPLSLPLVDLRATLCRALRVRAIGADEARAFLAEARRQHYVDRCWGSLPVTDGFREWLGSGAVSVKAEDAKLCLRTAASAESRLKPPTMVRTAWIEALARDCGVDLPHG